MNHHAMKIDYGIEDPDNVNPVFGGVLQRSILLPVMWTNRVKSCVNSIFAGTSPA